MEYRTMKIQVKRGDCQWETIDKLCFMSKNLYNSVLYAMRQDFDAKCFNFSAQHLTLKK